MAITILLLRRLLLPTMAGSTRITTRRAVVIMEEEAAAAAAAVLPRPAGRTTAAGLRDPSRGIRAIQLATMPRYTARPSLPQPCCSAITTMHQGVVVRFIIRQASAAALGPRRWTFEMAVVRTFIIIMVVVPPSRSRLPRRSATSAVAARHAALEAVPPPPTVQRRPPPPPALLPRRRLPPRWSPRRASSRDTVPIRARCLR